MGGKNTPSFSLIFAQRCSMEDVDLSEHRAADIFFGRMSGRAVRFEARESGNIQVIRVDLRHGGCSNETCVSVAMH
jgi:hypothetical protein